MTNFTGAKHGMTRTPTWRSWQNMLDRCRCTSSHRNHKWYAGKGVTVCDRWNPSKGGSFENFFSDMGERPEGKSLDKDKLGDGLLYSPETCCWLSGSEQSQQKDSYTNPKAVDARAAKQRNKKEKGNRTDWNKIAHGAVVSPQLVKVRVTRLGWTLERATTTPLRKCKLGPKGLSALAREKGIPQSTVFKRLERGWTLDRALNAPKYARKDS